MKNINYLILVLVISSLVISGCSNDYLSKENEKESFEVNLDLMFNGTESKYIEWEKTKELKGVIVNTSTIVDHNDYAFGEYYITLQDKDGNRKKIKVNLEDFETLGIFDVIKVDYFNGKAKVNKGIKEYRKNNITVLKKYDVSILLNKVENL